MVVDLATAADLALVVVARDVVRLVAAGLVAVLLVAVGVDVAGLDVATLAVFALVAVVLDVGAGCCAGVVMRPYRPSKASG